MIEIAEQEAAKEAYENQKNRVLYKQPVAVVPYPHKSKKVTAQGFQRDEPN